ncbi:PTS glucose transporter subunit IIBC [Vibrio panuliri]|uniref:PTS glucose transporter subunit IIBC n=1 Tax=Vibrio panuliri TaxID=1381081 RepID=A0A1Q9HDY9_9VIBR|nr:PTS transporter subunit EIIC [Vibrio panuliri]OLQ87911.1 PTS glucose transporter subunit IIBC [Vibrio panuliri]
MNKEAITTYLSDLSRAMLAPIYVLPLVGFVIAIGAAVTNPGIVELLPFLDAPFFKGMGEVLVWSTLSVLINLHIIFAVGISVGLAKKDKHLAGFNAMILYFVYLYTMNTYMKFNGLLIDGDLGGTGQASIMGLQVVDTGIFVGMLIGIINAYFHNKYSQKVLSGALSLYGESRLVLIIMLPITIGLGLLFTHIWPPVQQVIFQFGENIRGAGSMGVGVYGFLERILIPTGLHHLLWVPMHFTDLGGCQVIAGQTYCGVENIFLAEIGDPETTRLSSSIIFDSRSLVKIFGLTGAGLAMYHCADADKREKVKAIVFPAIASSILVGVTEPIEFSFLFVAPILFVVHAILTGLFMSLLAIFDIVAVGKGGLIDFIVYNVPLGTEKTDWPFYILMGLVQLAVYYVVFRALITKLNLKTLGRGEAEMKLHSKSDYKAKQQGQAIDAAAGQYNSAAIIKGLGGKDNIVDVQNCYTRLRVEVRDPELVNEAIIRESNPMGIVLKGTNIQIIFGSHVASVRQEVNDHLQVMA